MCNLEIYQCKNRFCRWTTHITSTLQSFWCGNDPDHTTRSQWTSCHDPKLEVAAHQGTHCPYFSPSTTLINKETSYCYPCYTSWAARNQKTLAKQRKLDRQEKARVEEACVKRQRAVVEMVWKQERAWRAEKERVRGEQERRGRREEMRRMQEDERHRRSLEGRKRREVEKRDRVLDREFEEFEEKVMMGVEGRESLRARMVMFARGC